MDMSEPVVMSLKTWADCALGKSLLGCGQEGELDGAEGCSVKIFGKFTFGNILPECESFLDRKLSH